MLLVMVLAGLTVIILKQYLVIENMTVLLKAVLTSGAVSRASDLGHCEQGLFNVFLSVSPCSSPV